MELQKKTLVMLGAVIAVQAVDAGLHIAINEVEMLRIMSNAVLVIGVCLGVFLGQTWRMALWAGAVGYIVLNLVFVAVFGLENPVTGVNRAPLFAFMALSLWLTYRVGRLRAQSPLSPSLT
ncbi:MAG: hypothetical protein Devi2KO_24140 [Devosia indica]|uniref:hypothetical protein n=1 Tax=Devosia TaxID=46913 RepID=UPI000CE97890|nr:MULTISPECIES: hypothetical protein [Devosia]AVF03434.1 hypothetical protein C4375_06635 [Devosia sp. I507]